MKTRMETYLSPPLLLVRRFTLAERGADDSQSFCTTTRFYGGFCIHVGASVIDSLMNPDKTKINYLSCSRINISNNVSPRKSAIDC